MYTEAPSQVTLSIERRDKNTEPLQTAHTSLNVISNTHLESTVSHHRRRNLKTILHGGEGLDDLTQSSKGILCWSLA